MLPCTLAIISSLGLHAVGLRFSKPASQSSPLSSATKYPAGACPRLSGFGLGKGCTFSPAMQPIPSCENAAHDQACWHMDTLADDVTSYSRDVKSFDAYSSLIDSITEVEAGGFGITLSTGVAYSRMSQVTEESIAFFIGQAGTSRRERIQNPGNLVLFSAAKERLRNDPKGFLREYGSRYVSSTTYGGSFLGSFTMNSRTASDRTALDVFAQFGVNKDFFSMGVGSSFQNEMQKQSSKVKVFANYRWTGGTNVTMGLNNTPAEMHDMFMQWSNTWRSNPKALTVTTRRWADSNEVQEIMNQMSDVDKALFERQDIGPTIMSKITREGAQITALDQSIKFALEWFETKHFPSTSPCLKILSNEVERKMGDIELLDDVDVMEIQYYFQRGNETWFKFQTYENRYKGCIAGLPSMFDIDVVSEGTRIFQAATRKVLAVMGRPITRDIYKIIQERKGRIVDEGHVVLTNRTSSVEGRWEDDVAVHPCPLEKPLSFRNFGNTSSKIAVDGYRNFSLQSKPADGPSVALRTSTGRYIHADSKKIVTASFVNNNARFTIQTTGVGQGVILLKQVSTGMYLRSAGGRVKADGNSPANPDHWWTGEVNGWPACGSKARDFRVGDRILVLAPVYEADFELSGYRQYCTEGKDLLTEQECRSAAQALGLAFNTIWHGVGGYRYCAFTDDGRSSVVFNTAGTQAGQTPTMDNYMAVCRKM